MTAPPTSSRVPRIQSTVIGHGVPFRVLSRTKRRGIEGAAAAESGQQIEKPVEGSAGPEGPQRSGRERAGSHGRWRAGWDRRSSERRASPGGRVRGVLLWSVWEPVDAARRVIMETGPFTAANLKRSTAGLDLLARAPGQVDQPVDHDLLD